MNLQDQINAVQSPVARELLQGLHDALCDAIMIPNELLPEEFHNNKNWEQGNRKLKVYGPTVAQINKAYDRKYAARDARREEKAEKEKRIAAYAAQWESNPERPIDYLENEDKLYENSLKFVEAGIRSGMITVED
jgi:hypothetical protein